MLPSTKNRCTATDRAGSVFVRLIRVFCRVRSVGFEGVEVVEKHAAGLLIAEGNRGRWRSAWAHTWAVDGGASRGRRRTASDGGLSS